MLDSVELDKGPKPKTPPSILLLEDLFCNVLIDEVDDTPDKARNIDNSPIEDNHLTMRFY